MPVALVPDHLGNIFSGSCVVDARNDSGLFDGAYESNLLAFYTSSLSRGEGQPDLQVQSIAYSKNGGASWEKWSGNPIIRNPGLDCYRDPKVIWFADGAHWVMLLTHGQSVGIYRSTDLLNWELASEFGEGQGHHSSGPWECPDLFELKTNEGESRWVLVVGIGDGCPAPGSGTQYFVGSFDGFTFTNETSNDQVRWLDLGRDHYATQSWFAAPNGRRVAIAWMSNWRYARHTSTRFFRGVMTLPRDMYLGVDVSGKHFVCQRFAAELDNAFGAPAAVIAVGRTHSVPAVFRARGRISFRPGEFIRIRLFDDEYDHFQIQRTEQGYEIKLVRNAYGGDDVFQAQFPHKYIVPIDSEFDELDIDMIVDAGAVELLLDGGRYSISQLFFPLSVAGAFSLDGSATGHLTIYTYLKE